ncbi:MAG TPA: hypothetical protein PKH69_02615 [Thiobacillaceae bacterium]|nr:hypothetical protein [Thiobacillaceae bacterium]HNU62981.1 hypothetical protein [Thiobacillaceae bacterium]
MRIDSLTYFSSGLSGMRESQSGIARLTRQLASDRRVLQPKDDALAMQRILDLSSRIATRSQFAANQERADLALKYADTVLNELGKTLEEARKLMAGLSPGHDAGLRNNVGQQLAGLTRHLLALANTRNPSGDYIFGGHATTAAPYANALTGAATATTYSGTPASPGNTAPDGQTGPGGSRWLEVEAGRYVRVNDNLDTVFQSGTANDLLQQLDDAAARIPGTALTQTDIDNWNALIGTAIGRLDGMRHRIAAASVEVSDVRATTRALLSQEQDALGETQKVDQAAAVVELQLRQTVLEAAGEAYARIAGLSLFSSLG